MDRGDDDDDDDWGIIYGFGAFIAAPRAIQIYSGSCDCFWIK